MQGNIVGFERKSEPKSPQADCPTYEGPRIPAGRLFPILRTLDIDRLHVSISPCVLLDALVMKGSSSSAYIGLCDGPQGICLPLSHCF